ncbi:hypothetical protein ELI45_02160 [Rhizobium ruizarguesonis]|uniref:hypothetical protein n=1 Tax=Rhizobium ruizarguesonis TaxID=2081791 RepID=UPI0010EABFE3|nr:hypothetical protein [Rhizobium ruizarguesonis]TAU66762.1 hypothetical protein ELI45_02160 [Rhizobium ruizarguesonis]
MLELDELRRQYPEIIRGDIIVRCLSGWRELVERALDEVIATGLTAEQIELHEIREKFGRLRITALTPAGRRDVARVFILASLRSQFICEQCGEPGKSLQTSDGWRMCRCDRHAAECPVPLSPVRPVLQIEMPDGVWRFDRTTDRLVLVGEPKIP